MARPRKNTSSQNPANQSLADRLQAELQFKQSYVNLFLGLLIVIVLGVLAFNYFKKPAVDNLGTASQTVADQVQTSPSNSPTPTDSNAPAPAPTADKYTVKAGDTLSIIAQNYYNDASQYTQIAQVNKIADPNTIITGQVLSLPKIAAQNQQAQANAPSVTATTPTTQVNPLNLSDKITGTTYTVQSGDWLSTIAGRAYGDIYSFDKIAKANNISNPNLIEPGTVLKIPR